MKIASIGGGAAGLYFSILMKKANPAADIDVYERNRADDTFGFGVVFSDETLGNFLDADAETYRQIVDQFAHWDDIDIHFKSQVLSSTGHGFSGFDRKTLLNILQSRCAHLGVRLHFETEITDLDQFGDCDLILAADGVNSAIRDRYADAFEPDIDWRSNRFVWLGTTKEFPAFTFIFKENEHGLWRVHAYRYKPGYSTFILECTADTFARSGLTVEDEERTMAYAEKLFADELDGHGLIKNRSHWRQFPTIRNRHWHHDNIVLMGDAVHTAHFSIGSGTKLAMEDSIALSDAMQSCDTIPAALDAYETARRPDVESTQRAAQVSLQWFEEAERYYDRLEPIQFGFSLLTRSLRISHENLRLRDPAYVRSIDSWYAARAANQSGVNVTTDPPHRPCSRRFGCAT